jgi:hypothetical protein
LPTEPNPWITVAAPDAVEDARHLVGSPRHRQYRDRPPDYLPGGITEGPFGGPVPTRNHSVERLADDRVFGRLNNGR